MRKVLFTMATLATVALFGVGTADAQCAFDGPGKAKGLKTSMVRVMASCPGVTHASPNTSAGTSGTPACEPVTEMSAYSFDAKKGKCDVKTKAKLEAPCSDGSADPCSNLSLQAKCGGILDPDNATFTNSVGWALRTFARTTFNDNSNGDMTVIDFPAQFTFPAAKKGKLKLKSDTNTLLNLLFGAGSALPGCTSIEILSAKIADPAGNLFATMGSGTR